MKSKLKQRLKAIEQRLVNLELPNIEVNVTELTELPEKWCVKDCEEVSKWAHEKHGCSDLVNSYPSYYHGNFIYKGYNYAFFDKIQEGYTEISFSDFERLVLNKTELEVGRWYKQSESFAGVKQYLIRVVKKDDLGVEGYDIIDGVWFDNGNCYCKDLTPATEKEVEEALINEAKKRGFKEGVRIKSPWLTGESMASLNDNIYLNKLGELMADSSLSQYTIMKNGIWAEIVEQPEEIDWSVKNQLLKYDSGTGKQKIIIYVEEKDTYCFKGYIVYNDFVGSGQKVGFYSENWSKTSWKPFTGELTIKNN